MTEFYVEQGITGNSGSSNSLSLPTSKKWALRTFCRIVGAFLLGICGLTANAQVIGVEAVPVMVHTGVYADGVDLTGFITWHVNLICENELDEVSAIYGLPLPDPEDIVITTSGTVFQHEFGGAFGNAINPVLFPAFPSLEWDSFVTMDICSQGEEGDVFVAVITPALSEVTDTFEGDLDGDYFDGGDFFIDDGAVFTVSTAANVQCGSDLRYKVAQITVKDDCPPDTLFCAGGGIDVELCVQSFPLGDQDLETFGCFETTEGNPCADQDIDPSLTVTTPLLCFGEEATIEIGGGGNGDLTLELFDANDDTLLETVSGIEVSGLSTGDYYIAITDEVGCYDTTATFSFVEPPELVVTTTFDQDNLCFGDDIAEVCVTVVGGTDPVTISGTDGTGATSEIASGECFSNLPCGLFALEVTDINGCNYEEDFDVACPPEIVIDLEATNPLCDLSCDGHIDGDVSGGTGDLVVQWEGPDGPVGTFTGPAPLDISIADLCEGIYTLTITDANDCVVATDFEMVDPEPLVTDVTFTNIACFGECNGTIEIDFSGGTAPLSNDCNDGSLADLCAGEYTCITTDANGCEVEDTVTITEPDQITYDLELTPLSCSDLCIGQIDLSNLAGGGGSGNWEVTLTPAAPTEVDLLPTGYSFQDLCEGNYDLSITDIDNNCTVTDADLVIFAPESLEAILEPIDISCFGLNDGMIEVTCEGGIGEVVIVSPVNQPCPSTIENQIAGTVTVTIEDEDGCQASATVDIEEPDLLELQVTNTTDVSCGGECDGTAEFVVTGGTGAVALTLNDGVIPGVSPIQGLCAADYVLCAIDANQCEACEDFVINQPDPIEILVTIDQVTCTGMTDGSANIFAAGGTGIVDLEILPEGLDLNNLGETTINVTATDEQGCSVEEDIIVSAEIQTDMEITLFSTPETCWETNDGTATAAVTGGFGFVDWLWSDPLQQTTETAIGLESNETYMVTVTDSIGCTIDTTLVVDPNIGCFFIATALTPNGDGYNDEWVVGGLEYFPEATVQVYNRWGQLLFESKGYDVPWDGTSNGNAVPTADYYYLIKYDETEEPLQGTVTVKY